MTDTAKCLENLQKLYDSIMEAMQGGAVQSVGHKGRQVAYNPARINDQIAMYNQMWDICGKDSGLPRLKPLDTPQQVRGSAIRVRFS